MPFVPPRSPPRVFAAVLFAALCFSQAACADESPRIASGPLLPKYKVECSACHLAYPPGLLAAPAWQRVMSELPRHFGTDASLDAATLKEIAGWLTANAGIDRRVPDAPPENRITRSAWFVRQHDEVPAATWKRAAVRSASNCAACHAGADKGDFNERSVRIPR